MRLLPPALLVTLTLAIELPPLQPFLSAIGLPVTLQDYLQPISSTNTDTQPEPEHDLLKRQFDNSCPDNFNSCGNLGAPGLCCAEAARCAADDAGNVACCPSGAACSGTIGGVITQGTVNSMGSVIGGGGGGGTASTTSFVVAGSTTGQGLVPASTQQTGSGFIVNSGTTVATVGAGVRGAEVSGRFS